MTVSIWQANGSEPVREVDFLVIGAGLVGCTVAYFAAQAGRQVVITDLRDIGLGASSRNAGFMISGLDTYYHHSIERYGLAVTREMWDISKTSHSYWREFARNGSVKMEKCGSMLLAESAEEARDLEVAARALEADHREIEYISSDPLDAAISPPSVSRGMARCIRWNW